MRKKTKRSQPIRVAVLISPDLGVRREALRGVYHYASGKTSWDLCLIWPLGERNWEALAKVEADGALVWPSLEGDIQQVKRLKIPVVTLGSLAHAGTPSVFYDNRAAARMGVEDLAAKGLKSVAFYGSRDGYLYSIERQRGFLETAKRLGLETNIFTEAHTEPDWKRLEEWLGRMQKPTGVLADTDVGGMNILTAARHMGIEIPEQLPLVSIGGDDLICPLVSTSLSSVALPGFEVGVEAAGLLDALLRRGKLGTLRRMVNPLRMVERRSSQFFYVEDEYVARALRYIRDHAAEPLSVTDVLAGVSLSRRPLEKRFRMHTGKTIQKAIWKAKLDIARRLLWETGLGIGEISDACGFAEPQRMTEVFKRELGLPPRAFRRGV